MRITTKAVWNSMDDFIAGLPPNVEEGFEYDGPIDLCGGGPSAQQEAAAAATASNDQALTGIAQQYNQRQTDAYNEIKPYATSRLQNGLPFYGGLTDYANGVASKAYAPVRAATLRSLSSFGSALPSGFATAALRDVDLGKAQNYDSNLVNNEVMNEQAKAQAAGLLTGEQQINNPVTAYGTSNQGSQSIMQAPLQSPGLGGLIGGLAGGVINKIPF